MSVETKRVMDEAIAANLADECDGAILSNYVLLSAGQSVADLVPEGGENQDGQHRYMFNAAEGQSMFATVGLSRMQAMKWDAEATFWPEHD